MLKMLRSSMSRDTPTQCLERSMAQRPLLVMALPERTDGARDLKIVIDF